MKLERIAGRSIVFFQIVFILLCAAASFPLKAETTVDQASINEINRLKTELTVHYLLNQLKPDEKQMQVLYDRALEGRKLNEEFLARELEILKKQEEVFQKFRAEDIANQGFDPATEKATHEADREGKEYRKEYFNKINQLEKTVQQSLNKDQLKILEGYKQKMPFEGILLQKNKPAAAKPDGGHHLAEPEKKQDEKEREIAGIKEELHEILKQKHGEIGAIGKLLICDQTLPALAKKMGRKDHVEASSELFEEAQERTRRITDLRTDINLLNLMNGMNFSVDQIAQLKKLVEKTYDGNDPAGEAKAQLQPEKVRKAKEALTEAVSCLEKNRPVPPELSRTLRDLKGTILAMDQSFPKARPPKPEEISTVAGEVSGLLQENQKKTLIDYNPCLIPPKNLKNPVRVGQANDTAQQVKAIEKLRKIPDAVFAQNKEKIIETVLDKVEEHGGKFTKEERESHQKDLSEFAGKVRLLSDVDFELQKEELAGQLKTLNKEETLKSNLKELVGDEKMLKYKIAANLLQPRILPLLTTRYNQLTQTGAQTPVDLDSVPAADSCARSGSCAINKTKP